MKLELRILSLLAPLALLAACESQSGVQSRYIAKQDECRDTAEDRLSDAPESHALTAKQRNAALVDHFSRCMIQAGWHVARPVKNPVVPTPPGTSKDLVEAKLPAQPLPGQPSDVITAASPAQSSPPNQPVKTQSNVLQPAPGQPGLSQPATSGGATYQPTNRAPVYEGTTGRPGRYF